MGKKLCKSRYDVKIDGVCAGFANYFNMDATLVRIIAVIAIFVPVTSWIILAYIICMFIMPREAEMSAPYEEDYKDQN